MKIVESENISLGSIVDFCWRNPLNEIFEEACLTTKDVSILAAWVLAATENWDVAKLSIHKGYILLLGKNDKTLSKITTTTSSEASVYKYKIAKTDLSIYVYTDSDIDISSFNILDRLLSLIVFLKYHIESVLLLPRELRQKRFEYERSVLEIPKEVFDSLFKRFDLIESYLEF